MYVFIGLMVALSLAAAFPLVMNYWRQHQGAASRRRVDGAVRRRERPSKAARPASRKSSDRRGSRRADTPDTPNRRHFKASSIAAGENCCPAVVKLQGKRFLTEEAPVLPLERCDRISECACTFNHHVDRRCGDDRRNPVGALSSHGQIGSTQINRRSGMDRRANMDDDFGDIKFL